jgi:geranyl-CoA carboxylase alpha subunit
LERLFVKRLLIANRSEIARRIIRTAHRMGLETVAVYSEADAQALHVRDATRAFALGGNASAESYLRIDKLLAAARATGADAVHPGYGFLSENAGFAQAVVDAGLIWVGPPATAIRALGSKSSAKQLALARGVPCLPGYFGSDQTDETLVAEAARIGYPVMVKAVAGGGGRGMRLVQSADALLAALHSARSEALAAFGSNELLLERALLNPRHIEIQIFADDHGHCIHLGERDCSVQRRHQKVIEETPSPAVSPELRERMGRCAVELAQAAGYVGAGTVEFLLDRDEFFLMEMNTRLQVEHPVTEAVTGLDLVEWQLRIARGEALPLAQADVRFSGHAIEVRLCAEDEAFTPHAGTVQHFSAPPGIRFDHALADGAEVPPHYDSMLGKLIAHGATRDDAIAQLLAALARTRVLGIPTNRAFLAACLDHAVFRAGQALIPFLQAQGDGIRELLLNKEQTMTIGCGLSAIYASKMPSEGMGGLPCPFVRPVRLRHRHQLFDLAVQEHGAGRLEVRQAGAVAQVHMTKSQSGQLRVVVDGVNNDVTVVALEAGHWHVQSGDVDLFVRDASFDPAGGAGGAAAGNELRAPFNGKVIALAASNGATLRKGDTALVIESMKLEHAIAAPRDARVGEVLVAVGQQVAPGQVLVRFEAASA